LPTLRDREQILFVHVQGKRLARGVDLSVVARGTPGFSGADLANLVNEAALYAARHDRDELRSADFEEARERLILGRRDDSTVLLPAERRTVAVRESGHALVAALSTTVDPVSKITILPTGMALGVTHQLQRLVDREVARLLRQAEERATQVLQQHRTALTQLTYRLLEEETLDGSVVYDIVRHEAIPKRHGKEHDMNSTRQWVGRLVLLVIPLLLTGCAARSFPDTPTAVVPQGGVNTTIGQIQLDDIWVNGPHGLAAAASAPLHLAMTNDSSHDDTLVRVTTPAARRVTLPRGGIVVPAGEQVNLEDHTDLQLQAMRHARKPGQWIPVTFEFARAGAVTVDVTVGPLGQ
jgi:copper(I)-binding protein